MNSNSYLGLSLRRELIEAEERASAVRRGPGAVRFISGTYEPTSGSSRRWPTSMAAGMHAGRLRLHGGGGVLFSSNARDGARPDELNTTASSTA